MERLQLSYSNVRSRFQQWLHAPDFNAESFRGIIMGIIIAANMGDVILYFNLNMSIKHGQFPWYIVDVLIITIGLLEGLSAPFWSLLSRWRLRAMMITSLILAGSAFSLMMLPNVPVLTGSEFCLPSGQLPPPTFSGMTLYASLRLFIIMIIALCSAACRSSVWNYSVSLIDQTDPQAMSLNFGIVVAARVLTLVMFPKMLSDDMTPWAQARGFCLPLLLHAFQLYRLTEPESPQHTRAKTSLRRILSSGLVVGQMLAAGLLTAALWGYMWHEAEIIKMKYQIVQSKDFITNQSDLLYYHVLILAVVTYGLYYGRTAVFDKASALKLAAFVSLLIAPLYCVQTLLLTCETGLVADGNVTCSTNCKCAAPYSNYAPVCVTDTLTTYQSPCHAGCEGMDIIEGLPVYRGCSCAPMPGAQRATVGACNVVQCRSAFILHRVVTAIIVIFTVLALQAQVVSILRTVDPLDRQLTVGLCTAVALCLTFGGSHLVYFLIRAWTCLWFEAQQCLSHSSTFLQATGGTSTALAGVSAVITLTTWLLLTRSLKIKEESKMD